MSFMEVSRQETTMVLRPDHDISTEEIAELCTSHPVLTEQLRESINPRECET